MNSHQSAPYPAGGDNRTAHSHIVVVFAYHYPPDTEIGAMRPMRFVKYLRRLGYRCLVVTAAKQKEASPDVIHVPDLFASSPGSGFGWHFDRTLRKFLVPGAVGMHWSLQAARAVQAALPSNTAGRVTILSTFPPLGTHLAAWRLARKTGLPWIADFRDPMVHPSLEHLVRPFQVRLVEWMEGHALETADVVIANTDAAAQLWKTRKSKRPIEVIWNGFDPEKRLSPLPLPERPFKLLSHVGALYHGRTVAPLLESIGRLIHAGKISPEQTRVQLAGPAEPATIPNAEFLARAREQGWLDLRLQSIPQDEAQRMAQSSDGLLLIQPHTRVQVPGKLFEYLQIGRPILAFILPDSPIERILHQSGVPYRCVYAGSGQEAFDESMLSFLRLPSDAVAANAWFESNFSADQQTGMLHELIQSLHETG
ncbi:MAG: glycosyltransferase [Bryobacterales bacterium]|nr:glycosyltransferase [Bryobacterales bacterium]